jgi:hypothetical protein
MWIEPLGAGGRGRIRLLLCAGIACALTLAVACKGEISGTEKTVSDDESARSTVTDYNAALMQSFRDTELSYMNPYATKDQLHRLANIIVGLKEEKVRLLLELQSLNIEAVTIEGDRATVKTQESWAYTKETLGGPQSPPAEKQLDEYGILYKLRRVEGVWLVDTIEKA